MQPEKGYRMNATAKFAAAFAAQIEVIATLPQVRTDEPLTHALAELQQWVAIYADTALKAGEGIELPIPAEPIHIPNPLGHVWLKRAGEDMVACAQDVAIRLNRKAALQAGEQPSGSAGLGSTMIDYVTAGIAGSMQRSARAVEIRAMATAAASIESTAKYLADLGHVTINDAFANALSSAVTKVSETTTNVTDEINRRKQQAREVRDVVTTIAGGLAGIAGGLFRRRPAETTAPDAEPETPNTAGGPASPGPDNPCLFPGKDGVLTTDPTRDNKGPASPGPDNPCLFSGKDGVLTTDPTRDNKGPASPGPDNPCLIFPGKDGIPKTQPLAPEAIEEGSEPARRRPFAVRTDALGGPNAPTVTAEDGGPVGTKPAKAPRKRRATSTTPRTRKSKNKE
jgi:flagellar hook-basal body complex protein FliE